MLIYFGENVKKINIPFSLIEIFHCSVLFYLKYFLQLDLVEQIRSEVSQAHEFFEENRCQEVIDLLQRPLEVTIRNLINFSIQGQILN